MSNALKGVFLSGLVFPGLGQVVLKHYKRGVIIMLAVSASLSVLAVKALQQALAILEKIQLEAGTASLSSILKAATQASTPSGTRTFNLVFLVVLLCWVIGVVDAYRIGKKKDIEESSPSQTSENN